jgi:hypothetical protein
VRPDASTGSTNIMELAFNAVMVLRHDLSPNNDNNNNNNIV